MGLIFATKFLTGAIEWRDVHPQRTDSRLVPGSHQSSVWEVGFETLTGVPQPRAEWRVTRGSAECREKHSGRLRSRQPGSPWHRARRPWGRVTWVEQQQHPPINVLMVNNPPMLELQKLTAANFTKQTGIKVNFVVRSSRTCVTPRAPSSRTSTGQYDVATLSNFEIPYYAKAGWISDMQGHRQRRDLRPGRHPALDDRCAVLERQGLRRAVLR